MTTKIEIQAELRENVGRGASRRLRFDDQIPAILYGAGEPARTLMFDHSKMLKTLSNETVYSKILTLKIKDKAEKVILKAVQRHPAKPRILHLDFQRIRADQKLHMHIPIHFLGEEKSPGVKSGGVVTHAMNDVEVVCLPDQLPEYLEIDISNLEMNQVIHLSELKLPKGVEFAAFAHGIEGHDLPVVSVHMPRIVEETIAPLAEETSKTAPPVEATSQKKEPEGGADKGDKGKGK